MIKTRSELLLGLAQIEDPLEKIKFMKNFYSDLPVQGSIEWQMSRRIGASMAAGVLGLSKYSSPLDVARQILGLKKDIKTMQMSWGNIFEPAVKMWLADYIEIHEFGSIPGFGINGEIYTSCSPDGVFIMTSDFALKHINNVNGLIGRPMLLEIKCPYMRPIKNEVPDYYLPQLFLGMETLSLCEGSSFCEFGIRMCSLQEFNFFGGCRVDKQRSIGGRPFAIGLIFAYGGDIVSREPAAVRQIELPYFEGATLLDQFHAMWTYLDKNFPSTVEFERFQLYMRQFGPLNYMSICKYFGKIVPIWDHVDFGAVYNFTSKWTPDFDTELLKVKNFKYIKPLLYNNQTDWECKEYLAGELTNAPTEDLVGVIPYKIYTAQVQYVAKKNYKEEIKKLCIFGRNIKIIKETPPEHWETHAASFCEIFNKTVLSIVPADEGKVQDS